MSATGRAFFPEREGGHPPSCPISLSPKADGVNSPVQNVTIRNRSLPILAPRGRVIPGRRVLVIDGGAVVVPLTGLRMMTRPVAGGGAGRGLESL